MNFKTILLGIILLAIIIVGAVMLFDTTTVGYTLTDGYKWAIGVVFIGLPVLGLILVAIAGMEDSKYSGKMKSMFSRGN